MALSPLFDLYDPYGILQQQAEAGILPYDEEEIEPFGMVPVGPRKATLSDLMPQEEQRSMLGRLADMGTSGLAGLGWILDTPGSMVRGLLSEGPMKGLSALWETSDDRVTGRELLRQYGMVGDEDNWGNFAGGIAAEALLDPTTYLSLGLNQIVGKGAKTVAGQAAQKAGLLDDFDLFARGQGMGSRQAMRQRTAQDLLGNIADTAQRNRARDIFLRNADADQLTRPLARMNRVSIPFMQPGATDLFGEGIGDAVARFGDQLGEGIATNPITGPAARAFTAAFDPNVMGLTDYDRQWEARGLKAAERNATRANRATVAQLRYDAQQALQGIGRSLNDRDLSEAFRNLIELGPRGVPEGMRDVMALPQMQALTDFARQVYTEAPQQARNLGIDAEEWMSRAGTGFFPRQQTSFEFPELAQWPDGVTPPERIRRPRGRPDQRVSLSDGATGRRRDYTDVTGGTDLLNRMSMDPQLQIDLRQADDSQVDEILASWARRNNAQNPYSWVEQTNPTLLPELDAASPLMTHRTQLADDLGRVEREVEAARILGDDDLLERAQRDAAALRQQIDDADQAILRDRQVAYRQGLSVELADMLRSLDPQHARRQVPLFGQNAFNELENYVRRVGRRESNAQSLLDILAANRENVRANQVTGGVNYTAQEALQKLGFRGENAEQVLANRLGVDSLDEISFNQRFVDDWARPLDRARTPPELSPLMERYDNFTKSFKTLALLWPARYSRDAYSGAFAAAMKNSFNPLDWYAGTQMRRGNYRPLVERNFLGLFPPRLAGTEYADLLQSDPQEAIRRFLVDSAGEGLGTSTAADELMSGAAGVPLRESYPGEARPQWREIMQRVYNPNRTWREAGRDFNPFAIRSAAGNRNPLLELGDRAAETTDAANRYGTYLNQIRQGAAPSEAARIANLTQVDYRPEAFTNFERDVMKRIMPFYSYSRGILPLIADQLIDNPQRLMGQSIRTITRASQPTDDTFTPEYLRQSASIPVPEGLPFVSLDEGSNLTRFLTNIDLPYESVINLFTPGVGNTLFDQAGNTFQKTALNLLGQTNPLIKGPLELFTNRQFYSGRQLSDLYSMLEQTLGSPGRVIEQVAVNAPGGSRLVGAVRQALDDRLSTSDKLAKFAVNALTGLKFQDVDQERTKRLAARDMLNQLLETTPGVRTYENITVPEEVLQTMPEEQRRMYLLYKIIQADAAKRARERKKQEAALDPLQVLGVVNQL
jgi:hypothetical protein